MTGCVLCVQAAVTVTVFIELVNRMEAMATTRQVLPGCPRSWPIFWRTTRSFPFSRAGYVSISEWFPI